MSSSTNTTGNALGGSDSIPPAGASGNGSGLAELIALFASLSDAKRLSVSLLAWVVYDFCLTVDDSIDLFWGNRWSMAKGLYLISRYNTLITMLAAAGVLLVASPSQPYCTVSFWIQVMTNGVLILVVNIALAARVQALYSRELWIRIVSLVCLIGNIGTYFIVVPYSILKGQITATSPPFTGCVLMPGFPQMWIILITGISYETIIITLTIYKTLSVAHQSGVRTPLYTLILGDGLLYYILIVASQIISLITSVVPTSISLALAATSPSVAVTGIACTHLFTHLQRHLTQRNLAPVGHGTEAPAHASVPRLSKKTKIPVNSWVGPSRTHHNAQANEATADRAKVPDQSFDLSAHFERVAAGPVSWSHEMQDLEKASRPGPARQW